MIRELEQATEAEVDRILALGGTAFPAEWTLSGGGTMTFPGMSVRDYFAAQALGGLIASCQFIDPSGLFTRKGAPSVASAAYLLADAMLAERVK